MKSKLALILPLLLVLACGKDERIQTEIPQPENTASKRERERERDALYDEWVSLNNELGDLGIQIITHDPAIRVGPFFATNQFLSGINGCPMPFNHECLNRLTLLSQVKFPRLRTLTERLEVLFEDDSYNSPQMFRNQRAKIPDAYAEIQFARDLNVFFQLEYNMKYEDGFSFGKKGDQTTVSRYKSTDSKEESIRLLKEHLEGICESGNEILRKYDFSRGHIFKMKKLKERHEEYSNFLKNADWEKTQIETE